MRKQSSLHYVPGYVIHIAILTHFSHPNKDDMIIIHPDEKWLARSLLSTEKQLTFSGAVESDDFFQCSRREIYCMELNKLVHEATLQKSQAISSVYLLLDTAVMQFRFNEISSFVP